MIGYLLLIVGRIDKVENRWRFKTIGSDLQCMLWWNSPSGYVLLPQRHKNRKRHQALFFSSYLPLCHFGPLSLCGENKAYILNHYQPFIKGKMKALLVNKQLKQAAINPW